MTATFTQAAVQLPDVNEIQRRIKAIDGEAALLRRLVRLLNRLNPAGGSDHSQAGRGIRIHRPESAHAAR